MRRLTLSLLAWTGVAMRYMSSAGSRGEIRPWCDKLLCDRRVKHRDVGRLLLVPVSPSDRLAYIVMTSATVRILSTLSPGVRTSVPVGTPPASSNPMLSSDGRLS
jgi:hypothetical protein